MPEEDIEEKKKFLLREEIRTMQKDIERLREAEARKERERIATLKTEEETRIEREKVDRIRRGAEGRRKAEEEARGREEALKKVEEERKKEIKEKLEKEREREIVEEIRKGAKQLAKLKPPAEKPALPKKPSFFEKVFIRVVVIIIFLLVLVFLFTFWYWYFQVRKAPPVVPEKPPAEEVLPPTEEVPEKPEVPPEEEIIEKPEIIKPEVLAPSITERVLDWGYYIPETPRLLDTIIIHSVYNALGGDFYDIEGVIQEYKIYGVAAHYLITGEGIIYRLAPEEAITYHAGVSKMPDGRVNVNNFSIGIEVIYTKEESPDEVQYRSLAQLVKYLQQQYNIPSENILGHQDIAPERKTDPWNFNWEYFQSLIQ